MPEHAALADLPAQTHALVFETDRPKTVRLRLEAGDEVPAHSHPGFDVVFHVVAGRMELTLDGETHDIAAGELLRFGGDCDISPRAPVDSSAVLVFAPADDD
ncbi:cupin domain-containing protein [Haloferax chudinovii]|uniref:Cupin domain-containing protein n=1 Tax=Haloferax chudinovii TaxID=1109010 RepID=A0ABD5XJ05_9EURY